MFVLFRILHNAYDNNVIINIKIWICLYHIYVQHGVADSPYEHHKHIIRYNGRFSYLYVFTVLMIISYALSILILITVLDMMSYARPMTLSPVDFKKLVYLTWSAEQMKLKK